MLAHAVASNINLHRLPDPTLPGVYNYKRSNMMNLRSGLLAMRAGTRNCKIVCVGDSNTVGFGSSAAGAGYTNAHPLSWPSRVAAQLTAAGVISSNSCFFSTGSSSTIANFFLAYPEVTEDAALTWFIGGGNGALVPGGGVWTQSTDITTNLKFTPNFAVDTFDYYYPVLASGGVVTFDVDGGGLSTQSLVNATAAMNKRTISAGSPGTHTLNLRRLSGSAYVAGVSAYDSTIKRVEMLGMGAIGSSTATWITNTTGYNPFPAITSGVYGQHLTIIHLGINDQTANADPTVTYGPNLISLVAALKAMGSDVWIVNPHPTGTAAGFDAYREFRRDFCLKYDVALFDPTYVWGPTWNAQGFQFDTLHDTGAGYDYEASIITPAILAALY